MFSLGLSLTLDDFRNVIKQPKALVMGLLNQMVLLPLVAFAIIKLFDITGALAVGLMILSACPGGVTSNIITKLAKGDVALSISYTAVVSVVSVLTLPLIAAFALDHFMGSLAPDMNILTLALQMFLITVIPVGIGLWLHHKKASFSKKFEPIASKISTGIFAVIVVAALASEWDTFVDNVKILGPAIVVLIVAMLLIGYFSSKAFKMREGQAVSVAIATGVQNATLGIALGNIILPAAEGLSIFSLPSGVYGILMYLVALPVVFLYVRFLRKKA
jgi:BASS family bile acid:Na+ symporter